MQFTFQDPLLPGISRFRALKRYGASMTMLRRMQLDTISGLDLSGCVLDFGGGTATNYVRYLPGAASYRSVNISDEFKPTDLIAPGDPLPFSDNQFDAVITFNVLEHIYDDLASLSELTRILKPGGSLHVMVPWMYPVHGHPSDFNRRAPGWWSQALADLGYASATLLPHVFGRRTSALSIKGRGDKAIRGLVETQAALLDIFTARLRFRQGTTYSGRRGATVWESASGWYIHAVKAP